ncbi:hypothetical protein, conserved [Plasmodium gonderi]|uniref:Uncharacterized protein n=1 Tax=Plasmodium gonderi TaxID=77519 RepID=A0A1Y1JSG5_PLAGO|nr:hypothetical protein, conserved [Plasmodium gonderi]GAW82904.1 hypothetical protein, conserved [Plasmodium gonderi]
MNENKKLDIIRNMLHTLLVNPEKEKKDVDDNRKEDKEETNSVRCDEEVEKLNACHDSKEEKDWEILKKKYIKKSKDIIFFYRNYMNKSEQKELEKFSNLYDIILKNPFEYSERDSIDTYMYCTVFPMLKKTFDSFVLYIDKLVSHKNDNSYKNVIKKIDPILLFSQYIIRLSDEDFSQSNDSSITMFDENMSHYSCTDIEEINGKKILELNKMINDECCDVIETLVTSSGNMCDIPTAREKMNGEMSEIEKEINNFYNKYDIIMEENRQKKRQKKNEILKSIYSKKNVLSEEEIALYDKYYEENINVKSKKLKNGNPNSSLSMNLCETNSFCSISVPPNAFNITFDLKERGTSTMGCVFINKWKNGIIIAPPIGGENNMNNPNICDRENTDVGCEHLDELIKELERKESSYFEKRIHFLLHKWVREEDGRRLIINQKSKIESLFNDFKKKNYTITDKDIISLIFFIDKNLYLNYSLVHQYNYNSFYYIFHMHSSFYCSDTNSITFEEFWNFLISNLPLNGHLYKEDIQIGLKKFYKKKQVVKNFQFTITFVKNFLLFLLMDMFLYVSHFAKKELNTHPIFPIHHSVSEVEIPFSTNFYLYIDSLSRFYSSSEATTTSIENSTLISNQVSEHVPTEMNITIKHITPFEQKKGEEFSKKESEQICSKMYSQEEEKKNGKRNVLLYLLMLLWGINIKMNDFQDELFISDELSTDMETDGINEMDKTNERDANRRGRKRIGGARTCDGMKQHEVSTCDGMKQHEVSTCDGMKQHEVSHKKKNHNIDIADVRNSREMGNKLLQKEIDEEYYDIRKRKTGIGTCQSDGGSIKKRVIKKTFQGMRSLSTNEGNTKYSLKKKKIMESTIKNKKKINVDELKREKKKKNEKYEDDFYLLRKRYKKKNYKTTILTLVHSIVKNIKPRKKNYYNKILEMMSNGTRQQVFFTLFSFLPGNNNQFNEQQDNVFTQHPSASSTMGYIPTWTDEQYLFGKTVSDEKITNRWLNSSKGGNDNRRLSHPCNYHTMKGVVGYPPLSIFTQTEIFPQVENFIQTYIKNKKKKKSSEHDSKASDTKKDEIKLISSSKKSKQVTSSIRLLCNFKLYKKKFLNKFTTEHIYMLILFVCYVNTIMDSLFFF